MSTAHPFKETGLGRVLFYIKDYWSIIVAVILVAAWMQTQYMLDVDTRDKVAAIPARTMQLITCQRHHADGTVYIDLGCLTAVGGSSLGIAPSPYPADQAFASADTE